MLLHHVTTPEAAQQIVLSGRFRSNCQDEEHAFFTTSEDGGRARTYGTAVVRLDVPDSLVVVDYGHHSDDELHCRVRLREVEESMILGWELLAGADG